MVKKLVYILLIQLPLKLVIISEDIGTRYLQVLQNLEEENRALRAKIKRIDQERDILKKPQRILQAKICKTRF
jgi:hypothetical protein